MHHDRALIRWLSSEENPAVRYLTARDLVSPPRSERTLRRLRRQIPDWPPLREILDLQRDDGSFAGDQRTPTAQPTLWALCLMARCGLDTTDEPVQRAVDHLTAHNLRAGALSYTGGGSGVLACYVGVVTTALIQLGALDRELVRASIGWLVDHQRFDHRDTRGGGAESWPYRAPANYGCWESVSCYHGVAGAFRALAAIPPAERSPAVRRRLREALVYLRIHRLYKKSARDQPLFRHMTQPFLIGDHRSDLLDMLQGVADADPTLINERWVRDADDDFAALTTDGRVPLVKNYGKKLLDPIPLEPVGQPSRFLTYQWLRIQQAFDAAGTAMR